MGREGVSRKRSSGAGEGREEGVERGEGPVDGVELQGVEASHAPQAVLDAIAGARAVIVGPSNPVISVRTILEVPGIGEAMRATTAPVVAVSPIVGGEVLKGPTEVFMTWAGLPASAAGTARAYDEDDIIEQGRRVQVVEIRGATALVSEE